MSTTTPHRALPMATSYSPSQTTPRRVLGHLPPKAINTPSSQSASLESSQVARAQSPWKQPTTQASTALRDKENLASLYEHSKGKKRGIEEVDSAEVADHLKTLARRRGDSLMGPAVRLTTDAMHVHTQNNPVGLANLGSPTERNTPTPEPEMVQNSQKSNQSFSDFLDYGMCASQKSEHGIPLESAPKPAPTLAPIAARKARAEQLRTRLKFGLYKVATNQVGRRDADIISAFEARVSYSSGTPTHGARTAARTPYTDSHRVPNITISSPRRDPDVVLVKANLDPFRPIGKLGPAPVLFPPPSDNLGASSYPATGYDPLSSPPGVSPQPLASPDRQRTHHPSHVGAHDDTDMNSRMASAHLTLDTMNQPPNLERDITASAVKDNAAEGLIELMSSTR